MVSEALVCSLNCDSLSVLKCIPLSVFEVKTWSSSDTGYLIKIFSALQNDLKYASNERILLEVAMLKLCSITEEKNIDDISDQVNTLRSLQ